MNTFKNRGHFCNYCRVIIRNKTKDCDLKGGFPININTTIWNVWKSENSETIRAFVSDLSKTEFNTLKGFNKQLKTLRNKYGESETK